MKRLDKPQHHILYKKNQAEEKAKVFAAGWGGPHIARLTLIKYKFFMFFFGRCPLLGQLFFIVIFTAYIITE